MSLINQMLRDLEQRQSPRNPGANPLAGLRSSVAASARVAVRDRRWMLFVLLGAATLGGIQLTRIWHGGQPASEAGRTVDAQRAPATPRVVDAMLPIEAVAAPTKHRAPRSQAVAAVGATHPAASRAEATRTPDTALASNPTGTPVKKTATEPATRVGAAAAESRSSLPANRDRSTTTSPEATAPTPAVSLEGAAVPPLRQASTTSRPDAGTLHQRALAALRQGDPRTAETLLRRALDQAPGLATARSELAGLLIATRRRGEAAALLDAGLALAPADASLARLRARLLLESGELDGAATLLQASLPSLAESPEHYALLAATEQRRGRDAVAAELYRRLVAVRPGAGHWQVGLAISLERLGKSVPAASAYRMALGDLQLTAALRRYASERLQALDS